MTGGRSAAPVVPVRSGTTSTTKAAARSKARLMTGGEEYREPSRSVVESKVHTSLSSRCCRLVGKCQSNARRVHSDLVDAGARGDVERLFVGVAETDIGRLFRYADGAEVLAFRRDDPHAAGRGLVEI